MSRIAIIGPGAVGGTVAARLGHTGRHEVTVCARTPVDRLELETPEGVLTSMPSFRLEPVEGPPVDWILVATKAYQIPAAAAWLPSLAGPETCVAVLQNGVEQVKGMARYFDTARILPVVVDCPAERLAPGRIRQRRAARLTVPEGPMGRAFLNLFAGAGIEVLSTRDFATAAWTKLCLNSAGAVDALTLKTTRVVHFAEAAELIRGIVRECIAVGRAEGADLPDSLVEQVIASYEKAPADSINSLHADRLAGRPMEIEARNGVIVRCGARHAILTPLNRAVVALLKAIESP